MLWSGGTVGGPSGHSFWNRLNKPYDFYVNWYQLDHFDGVHGLDPPHLHPDGLWVGGGGVA